MKKKFLFISCDEAKHICDKAQYGEATGWEQVQLSLRLMWCKFTKSYSKSNSKLTDAIEKAHVSGLKLEERKKLQKKFEEDLTNNQ